jgi:hypothetical protein
MLRSVRQDWVNHRLDGCIAKVGQRLAMPVKTGLRRRLSQRSHAHRMLTRTRTRQTPQDGRPPL